MEYESIKNDIIEDIIYTVKQDYEQQIYDLKQEIAALKNRIDNIEETMAWAAHRLEENMEMQI